MANKIFGAIGLIGGANGSLDTVKISTLSDGDLAIAVDSNEEAHIYRFESSSTAAESSPQAVRPDDYATAGVWILTDLSAEDLKIYGDAVIDGALTQTGLLTATTGVDITGYLSFDAAGVQLDAIKDEDDLVSDSNTAIATQRSIKAYVDSVTTGVTLDMMAGFTVPTLFTYYDTNTIILAPARYHHDGLSEQLLKWDANLSYDMVSLGVSDWSYLYLDDSAIDTAGTNIISTTQLIDTNTEPTWSDTKLGYYSGGDKCIGAFLTNASSQIIKFVNKEIGYIEWADEIEIDSGALSTSLTFTAPSFCKQVMLNVSSQWTTTVYYDAADLGTDKFLFRNRHDDNGDNQAESFNSLVFRAAINSSLQCTITGVAKVDQWGYFLPKGMI